MFWVSLFKYLNTLLGSKKAKIEVANLARRQRVIGPGYWNLYVHVLKLYVSFVYRTIVLFIEPQIMFGNINTIVKTLQTEFLYELAPS